MRILIIGASGTIGKKLTPYLKDKHEVLTAPGIAAHTDLFPGLQRTYSNYWIGMQALVKSEVLPEQNTITPSPENTNVYSRLSEGELQDLAEAIGKLPKAVPKILSAA